MANIFQAKDYEKDPNFVGPPSPPNLDNNQSSGAGGVKNGSNGIWDSVFNNAGSIFGGIGTIIGSWKGTNPDTNYIDNRRQDNTSTYMVLGVVVILIIIVLFFYMGKK